MKIGEDRLRGVSLLDIEVQWVRQHQGVVDQIEGHPYAVLRMRRGMHLPAKPRIYSERLVDTEIVLKIEIELLLSKVSERSVLHLAV